MSRKHRSEAQWLELINAFEKSGQSQADFCAEQNVSSAYFTQRRRALRNLDEPAFAEVKPQAAYTFLSPNSVSPALTLRYQQTELALPLSVEPRWLAGLIKALSA
ncbi:IS66 family insertion sequence element accessory protein TnpA [Oceanisphaera ostreae]|uniref:Transposase n=1 Tax=Oceanisphaera ostreae TaxID=914151 RepID=A0ABW3KDP4_9GAMM